MVNVINTSFEEGEQIGIEKGKVEGKIEGKIETACNMLKDEMPIELISKYTGMTVEEISNLKCD